MIINWNRYYNVSHVILSLAFKTSQILSIWTQQQCWTGRFTEQILNTSCLFQNPPDGVNNLIRVWTQQLTCDQEYQNDDLLNVILSFSGHSKDPYRKKHIWVVVCWRASRDYNTTPGVQRLYSSGSHLSTLCDEDGEFGLVVWSRRNVLLAGRSTNSHAQNQFDYCTYYINMKQINVLKVSMTGFQRVDVCLETFKSEVNLEKLLLMLV